MTARKVTEQERENARQHLLNLLHPGDTIYSSLRSVSRSGMSRQVSMYCVSDNKIVYISGWVALATGARRNRDGYLVLGGCGTDVGSDMAHYLGYTLFPNGFDCVQSDMMRCPSNDHSNLLPSEVPVHHTDGGYALRHQWLD